MTDGYYDPEQHGRAVPARHVHPAARQEPGELQVIPSLGEIEQRLMRCDDELAQLVIDHYDAAEVRARAEADWKAHRDRVLVRLADNGVKEAADIREGRARKADVEPDILGSRDSMNGEELYRIYKLAEARELSVDRQLRAVQSRMSGMQSVARGIRGVT